MNIRIGTRGSKLALWQAEHTQAELSRIGISSELVIIKTKGDVVQDLSFDKMEGKGFFTREIEDALLRGEIDVAVHSMKDLSTQQPEGLVITAVSYREDAADWLLIRRDVYAEKGILRLPPGARVGTSASRRKAQLLDIRPDVTALDLRGNVPTRLEKLRQGDYDAIVLAAAGLNRLGLDLSDLAIVQMNPREFVPAPGQAVLAWQTNRDDLTTRRIFKQIHHAAVSACTNIERGVLQLLDGGCQLPLGVYCERDAAGNFHTVAAGIIDGEMRRVHISSTTRLGIAEKVVAALKSA
jgi:hydroxymethylbilane synthase